MGILGNLGGILHLDGKFMGLKVKDGHVPSHYFILKLCNHVACQI